MLQMLQGLDFERYGPRTYLVSEGDQFSAAKAAEFESRYSFSTVRFLSAEKGDV
jgi:Oligosaccharide biosynthesis protein Alg14 like